MKFCDLARAVFICGALLALIRSPACAQAAPGIVSSSSAPVVVPAASTSASVEAASTSPFSPGESSSAANEEKGKISFEPAEKVIAGAQHYLMSDSSLVIDLPNDFNVNVAYSFYQSDSSSRTATIDIGAAKYWDEGSLSFTYSFTPLVNNYRSHAFETAGTYNTASRDFRTTFGATFNVIYHTQIIPGSQAPKISGSTVDILQKEWMLNLRQRIYNAKLTLDFGKSAYNQEIARLSNKINPNSARFQGLSGLLTGFPDLEWKFGAYQDLWDQVVTFWATYDHIKLLLAGNSAGGGASDSYMVGTDVNPLSWLTATLQYNYLTQTGQPPNNYYGLSLGIKI